MTHFRDLFDDVQLAEPVAALRLIGNFDEPGRVFFANAAHVPQPVVNEAELVAPLSRPDASAIIMTANNDVPDFQHVNRELDHGHAIEVGMLDDIGYIAVNEHLSRQQAHDLIRRHAAVRTPDP